MLGVERLFQSVVSMFILSNKDILLKLKYYLPKYSVDNLNFYSYVKIEYYRIGLVFDFKHFFLYIPFYIVYLYTM